VLVDEGIIVHMLLYVFMTPDVWLLVDEGIICAYTCVCFCDDMPCHDLVHENLSMHMLLHVFVTPDVRLPVD
jgi:hypothetical protein